MGKLISIVALSLLMFAGGPPSKGTDADNRLKRNNPNAGKKPIKIPIPVVPPVKSMKPMSQKKGVKI